MERGERDRRDTPVTVGPGPHRWAAWATSLTLCVTFQSAGLGDGAFFLAADAATTAQRCPESPRTPAPDAGMQQMVPTLGQERRQVRAENDAGQVLSHVVCAAWPHYQPSLSPFQK